MYKSSPNQKGYTVSTQGECSGYVCQGKRKKYSLLQPLFPHLKVRMEIFPRVFMNK